MEPVLLTNVFACAQTGAQSTATFQVTGSTIDASALSKYISNAQGNAAISCAYGNMQRTHSHSDSACSPSKLTAS